MQLAHSITAAAVSNRAAGIDAAGIRMVIADLTPEPALDAHRAALGELRVTVGAISTMLITAQPEVGRWRPVDVGVAAILVKPFATDELLGAARTHSGKAPT